MTAVTSETQTPNQTTSDSHTASDLAPGNGSSPWPAPKRFVDLGVEPALSEALAAKGIFAPFPIQELTLPVATAGHDVIGQARTGTGKTLAFALALLGRIKPGAGTQALVVVPTRELCLQVAEELQIGQVLGLSVIAVYGGVPYEDQERAFRAGVEVVVGTPGRLLDHLGKGNLRLEGVTELVLDEADEMLDMGFLPDVERLIEACRSERHSMLFSATMPTQVVKLARRYLDRPTFMRADHEPQQTVSTVEQHFFQVHRMDKPRLLARILQSPERSGVYVFVRTKLMADRLVRELDDLGVAAIAIHGDLRQATRERNLDRFRDGSADVLVATEVAARGLDVENVSHVVNYDCPEDEKMYLHRIGRTARAGARGVAITFAEFNEIDRLNMVRKALGATDHPIEPVFSTSELIAERFNLPTDRPWDHLATTAAPRRARSDGRPKSQRSAEGRGGDHDARRRQVGGDHDARRRQGGGDARRRQGGSDHDARRRQVGGDARREDVGGRDPQSPTRTRSRTRTTEAAPSARTRTRTRAQAAAPDTTPASERTRARRGARKRTVESAPPGSGGGPAGESPPTAEQRTKTQRRPDGATEGPRKGEQRKRNRSGDQRKRQGSEARRRQAGGDTDARRRQGGGDTDARRRQGGGDTDARRRQGGGDQPAGRRAADRTATTLAKRGREARGEGEPQVHRRVNVEHLP